jgi:hypothetical protein
MFFPNQVSQVFLPLNLLVVYLGKEGLTHPMVVSTFHQRSSSLFNIQNNCTYVWNIWNTFCSFHGVELFVLIFRFSW